MRNLIGWILKASIFTVIVLVAAHYVTWDGKTVSDQVRSTLSSAEKSPSVKTIQKKSKALLEDAKETVSHVGIATEKRTSESSANDDKIPVEDRATLQALIHSAEKQ